MINIPANIPKEEIGIILLNPVAKKAADVVDYVANIALLALLYVKAILWFKLILGSFSKVSLYREVYSQASTNTNMLAAEIPNTMKITVTCRLEK